MTNDRRNRVPGGTTFFTVNLLDRRSALLVEHIQDLRSAVRHVRAEAPFHIDAWAVLPPEHMHCVWTLPDGDMDFSSRWKTIKGEFSKSLPSGELRSATRAGTGERGIGQRRFWDHTIRHDRDDVAHIDYVHVNPVKRGIVSDLQDWPTSSFHRHVALGIYPASWADGTTDIAEAGERL
jgi:putative transposase